MNLLESLYRGKTQTFSEMHHWDPQSAKLVNQLVEVEKQLNNISPEVEVLLSRYQDLQGELDSLMMYQEFSVGFRVGAQLMAEMLQKLE